MLEVTCSCLKAFLKQCLKFFISAFDRYIFLREENGWLENAAIKPNAHLRLDISAVGKVSTVVCFIVFLV